MHADDPMPSSDLGFNVNGINTVGSTDIGRSKNALDGSSAAVTATLPFRILEFVDGPDSVAGDAFTDAIVTILPGKHAYLAVLGI